MKKTLSILLATAMLIALFAGCGTPNRPVSSAEPSAEIPEAESAKPTPTEMPSSVKENASEEETEAAAVPHQYNFPNSKNALLDYTNEYELPLCEETETITWMRNAVNLMGPMGELGISGFQDFQYIQYLQEITNVNIEFTELNFFTSQEMMNIAFASGDFSDVVTDMKYTGGDTGAYNDGVILDLTEYLPGYAPNYDYMIHSNPDYASLFKTDGMVLSFMSPYENFVNNQGLAIRSDWLEELELEKPKTYDDMYKVLMAFQEHYTAEPLYMSNTCYINGFVTGFDVEVFNAGGIATELPFFVKDGVVCCSLIEDGYRDYLAEMNKWYKSGLFNSDFASVEFNPVSNELTAAVDSGEFGVWNTSGEGVDNYAVPFACLPAPTANEDGMDHITSTALTVDTVNTYVTTCCENVEVAMRLLDYSYSEDGILLHNYGFEGEDYTIDENGTPQFTETVVNNEFGVSAANYMRIRCGYAVFSSLQLRYRSAYLNSDINNEAWEVWSSNIDGTMTMPSNVSLNAEETETMSYYTSDILTHAAQMVPQFIMGIVSLDQWDAFVEELKSMNIEECIAVQQSAYDRCIG